MAITIITEVQVCDAIADTFRQIPGLTVQSYNELTDGIPTTPLLQVYWWKFIEDAESETDRAAAQHKVVIADDTYRLDLYAKERGELREDFAAVMENLSEMRQVVYDQQQIYFGLKAIKSMKWQAQYANLKYGDPMMSYAGARVTMVIRIF